MTEATRMYSAFCTQRLAILDKGDFQNSINPSTTVDDIVNITALASLDNDINTRSSAMIGVIVALSEGLPNVATAISNSPYTFLDLSDTSSITKTKENAGCVAVLEKSRAALVTIYSDAPQRY